MKFKLTVIERHDSVSQLLSSIKIAKALGLTEVEEVPFSVHREAPDSYVIFSETLLSEQQIATLWKQASDAHIACHDQSEADQVAALYWF